MKNNAEVIDFDKVFEQSVIKNARANDVVCSEMKEYKRDGVNYITVDYPSFKAIFIFGLVSYGYSFFEGSDVTSENGVIVRFKFDFSDIYFSPYDVHNALNLSKFEILDFHISENSMSLEANVDRLFRFISENMYQLEEIAKYPSEQSKLIECYMHDLQVTSKGIYKKGIEQKTKKRLRSHEIDMFYYNSLSYCLPQFLDGKPNKLKKELEKRSSKGKLLMFEERYYKYLEAHDYQMPDEASREKFQRLTKKESKSKLAYLFVLLASVVICVAISFLIRLVVEKTSFADYMILLKGNSEMFIIPIFAVLGFLSLTIDKIHLRKYDCSLLCPRMKNKTLTVIQLICFAIMLVCFFIRINEAYNTVAMNETQVVISKDIFTQEVYDINNDRIKFIEIDGYYADSDYYVDDRDFIIVVDNDYENYSFTDLSEKNLERALSIIDENNAFALKYKSIEDFREKHLPELK